MRVTLLRSKCCRWTEVSVCWIGSRLTTALAPTLLLRRFESHERLLDVLSASFESLELPSTLMRCDVESDASVSVASSPALRPAPVEKGSAPKLVPALAR